MILAAPAAVPGGRALAAPAQTRRARNGRDRIHLRRLTWPSSTSPEDWGAFGRTLPDSGNSARRAASGKILGEGSRTANVDIDRPAATGWLDFIKLGIEHILTGYDHLLFLVALLATARSVWSVGAHRHGLHAGS